MRTAEAHLGQGDGAAALELLVPQLDRITSADDLARLNADLAQAELLLGHFKRSAGYYEAAFALDPSPEMLLELASAYDLGGDLHSALARYLRLAAWDGADETLRQIARDLLLGAKQLDTDRAGDREDQRGPDRRHAQQ